MDPKPDPWRSNFTCGAISTHENMPLLDRRELIFEWALGQRFGPPTNIENEVHVDVDDINNENNIAEGNDFNDEIADRIFEDVDSDEDTSTPATNSIEI